MLAAGPRRWTHCPSCGACSRSPGGALGVRCFVVKTLKYKPIGQKQALSINQHMKKTVLCTQDCLLNFSCYYTPIVMVRVVLLFKKFNYSFVSYSNYATKMCVLHMQDKKSLLCRKVVNFPKNVKLKSKNFNMCLGSSVDKALALKSRGPGFDPGSGHIHDSHVSAEC